MIDRLSSSRRFFTKPGFEVLLAYLLSAITLAIPKLASATKRSFFDMSISFVVQCLVWLQSGNNSTLKPIILDEIIEEAKARIRRVIAREIIGPEEHMKLYDVYQDLITKKVIYFSLSTIQYRVTHVKECYIGNFLLIKILFF